jgi:hypothetical protein
MTYSNGTLSSTFISLLSQLEGVEYRNQIDPILDQIRAAESRGDIMGPQAQMLEKKINELRQLPHSPAQNYGNQQNVSYVPPMPSSHPQLTHSAVPMPLPNSPEILYEPLE